MILARPEITGATNVLAALGLPRSPSRAVARPPVAPVTIAALDSQITTNLRASDVAKKAAPEEPDWTSNDGSRDSSYCRVCQPIFRSSRNGQEDECRSHEAKSTKRSHVSPCRLSTDRLSRRLRRIWDSSTRGEQIVVSTRPTRGTSAPVGTTPPCTALLTWASWDAPTGRRRS